MSDRDLRAVVFDVDGTLVDSERDGHRRAFNEAFEEFDLPYRWDPEPYGDLLAVTGGERRIASYLEDQGVDDPERSDLAAKLHARKTELFQALIGEGQIPARPGASELVDELETAGVRLAVATTGSRAWVEPLLRQLFGENRFEVVVTGDEAPDRKPDPSAYLRAVEGLGLAAADVVALEDSRNGLVAAKAAGLSCVVVVNDYTHDEEFDEADLVVTGFRELDVDTIRRVAARAASPG